MKTYFKPFMECRSQLGSLRCNLSFIERDGEDDLPKALSILLSAVQKQIEEVSDIFIVMHRIVGEEMAKEGLLTAEKELRNTAK